MDKDKLIARYGELVRNLKFAWLPVTKEQDEVVKSLESEIASLKAEGESEKPTLEDNGYSFETGV